MRYKTEYEINWKKMLIFHVQMFAIEDKINDLLHLSHVAKVKKEKDKKEKKETENKSH